VAKPIAKPMNELVQVLARRPNPDGKASRYADLQTQTAGRLFQPGSDMPKHRGSPDVSRGIRCLVITLGCLAGWDFGCIAASLGQKRHTSALVVSGPEEPVSSGEMLDLLDYSESEIALDVGEREQESGCNHLFSRGSYSDIRRVIIL
jgi:hypothetical protein